MTTETQIKEPTMYIYELPFKGNIKNTMHYGNVDYTGERVEKNYTNEKGCRVHEVNYINPLNFDQYNELNGGNLKVATWEEIEVIFSDFETQNVLSSFVEITEEKWYNALECLPPKRWHHFNNLEIFFIGECLTSNIYGCYVFDKESKKYFSAYRRITETSEQIETIYKDSI